jgi:hypothetical protein
MVVITVAFPSPESFLSIGVMLKAARHGDRLDIKPSMDSSGFAAPTNKKAKRHWLDAGKMRAILPQAGGAHVQSI